MQYPEILVRAIKGSQFDILIIILMEYGQFKFGGITNIQNDLVWIIYVYFYFLLCVLPLYHLNIFFFFLVWRKLPGEASTTLMKITWAFHQSKIFIGFFFFSFRFNFTDSQESWLFVFWHIENKRQGNWFRHCILWIRGSSVQKAYKNIKVQAHYFDKELAIFSHRNPWGSAVNVCSWHNWTKLVLKKLRNRDEIF